MNESTKTVFLKNADKISNARDLYVEFTKELEEISPENQHDENQHEDQTLFTREYLNNYFLLSESEMKYRNFYESISLTKNKNSIQYYLSRTSCTLVYDFIREFYNDNFEITSRNNIIKILLICDKFWDIYDMLREKKINIEKINELMSNLSVKRAIYYYYKKYKLENINVITLETIIGKIMNRLKNDGVIINMSNFKYSFGNVDECILKTTNDFTECNNSVDFCDNIYKYFNENYEITKNNDKYGMKKGDIYKENNPNVKFNTFLKSTIKKHLEDSMTDLCKKINEYENITMDKIGHIIENEKKILIDYLTMVHRINEFYVKNANAGNFYYGEFLLLGYMINIIENHPKNATRVLQRLNEGNILTSINKDNVNTDIIKNINEAHNFFIKSKLIIPQAKAFGYIADCGETELLNLINNMIITDKNLTIDKIKNDTIKKLYVGHQTISSQTNDIFRDNWFIAINDLINDNGLKFMFTGKYKPYSDFIPSIQNIEVILKIIFGVNGWDDIKEIAKSCNNTMEINGDDITLKNNNGSITFNFTKEHASNNIKLPESMNAIIIKISTLNQQPSKRITLEYSTLTASENNIINEELDENSINRLYKSIQFLTNFAKINCEKLIRFTIKFHKNSTKNATKKIIKDGLTFIHDYNNTAGYNICTLFNCVSDDTIYFIKDIFNGSEIVKYCCQSHGMLWDAVVYSKTEITKFLLNLGIDVNIVNNKTNESLLMYAIKCKSKCLDILLNDKNINVTFVNNIMESALTYAMDDRNIYSKILNKIPNVNTEIAHMPLLAISIKNMTEDFLDYVLNKYKNVDINFTNKFGRSLLSFAITSHNFTIALKLVNMGASYLIEQKFGYLNDMFRVLVERDIIMEQKYDTYYKLLKTMFEKNKIDMNMRDKNGQSVKDYISEHEKNYKDFAEFAKSINIHTNDYSNKYIKYKNKYIHLKQIMDNVCARN